jgi:hypothetical protein
MLVTFSTDSYADITMFGDVAVILLKMMGHSGTMPGAVLAVDVPVALNKLKTAINAEKASSQTRENAPASEDEDTDEPAVSLAHRALPLIELLTAAEKAETDVMWKST